MEKKIGNELHILHKKNRELAGTYCPGSWRVLGLNNVIYAVVCVAVCCSVLQCVAVCCSVLQCGTVCCSMVQCVAVCCSVLQCVAMFWRVSGLNKERYAELCVAVFSTVLQCVTVCTVTHRDTLQHTRVASRT